MCFSIPIKVLKVKGANAVLENGKKILIKNTRIKAGQYVRISGNSIVDTLSKKEGDSIRHLIANVYKKL
jgi:hydrogenase maturation factor